MLTHRGFSAWITVDNEILSEYLVAVDPKANKISCWIPSQVGKEFTVHWQDHGSKEDSCAYITLDGFTVPGRFLFGEGVAWRRGIRTSKSSERPFVFQQVEEDTDGVNSKELGMITLKIKKVERITGKPANPLQPLPTVLGKRKVGDLCIGFGEERAAFEQYAYTWQVKGRDESGRVLEKPSTHVTFVFRYRSPEFLQSQGIMPDDDSPKTTPIRAPGRRIVSAPSEKIPEPASPSTPLLPTPTVSPVKASKKPRIDDNQQRMPTGSMRAVSTRLQRPSAELRRSVSWKTVSPRPGAFPGEGLLGFDDLPIIENDEVNDLFGLDNPG